jgi:two-component system NtrC family response regulator
MKQLKTQPKVLVVDDEVNTLTTLSTKISKIGFFVETCHSGESALELLEHSNEINVVITDLAMAGMSGEDLFVEINQRYPYIPVIVLTAHGSVESAVGLLKNGAFDYLEKPSNKAQLIKTLKSAARHNSLHQEIQFLRQELNKKKAFCNIVGRSRKMIELYKRIKIIADSNFSVLVEGESGTGKELVATAIHQKSPRKDNPFITINCAAIPHTLIESELFGYEQGAFTGALNQKIGKLELANKGTLFLDEISELDENLQSKLLRVLEEKKVHRVGGNTDIKIDFRLIAATNRDLRKYSQKKHFREDLYYRLNVIDIKIPPLKERKEDISLLVGHFLKKYSVVENKRIPEITPQAMNTLFDYDWPGNVRELENVIKRAIVLCRNHKIKEADLPTYMLETKVQIPDGKKNKKTIDENEKKEIIEKLKKTKGNKTKAAKLLGIDRRQLYRDIEKYQIDSEKL